MRNNQALVNYLNYICGCDATTVSKLRAFLWLQCWVVISPVSTVHPFQSSFRNMIHECGALLCSGQGWYLVVFFTMGASWLLWDLSVGFDIKVISPVVSSSSPWSHLITNIWSQIFDHKYEKYEQTPTLSPKYLPTGPITNHCGFQTKTNHRRIQLLASYFPLSQIKWSLQLQASKLLKFETSAA